MTALLENPPAVSLEPPRRTIFSVKALVIVVALIALHVLAFHKDEIKLGELAHDFSNLGQFIISPDFSWSDTIHPGLDAALLTFCIGLMGTTLALPFALVFAILGSRLMTPTPLVFQVVRFVMSILRAVPAFVFALFLIVAVGLGPFPGVLALFIHGIGVSAKLWWDAIDDIDPGPVEALRTTGANEFQVLQHGVLPIVTRSFVASTLFRLDDNVRSALVLGLVGAQGIGQAMNNAVQTFAFSTLLTDVVIMLVMIVAIDQLASYVGNRLATTR